MSRVCPPSQRVLPGERKKKDLDANRNPLDLLSGAAHSRVVSVSRKKEGRRGSERPSSMSLSEEDSSVCCIPCQIIKCSKIFPGEIQVNRRRRAERTLRCRLGFEE